MSDNANNGLITKIWGPPLWKSLHCIAYGYPIEPTDEIKTFYKNFFVNLGNVLPCKYCRISYNEFIKVGDTTLNDEVFESRYTLTKWLYRLHNRVNKKLDVDYGIEYEEVNHRYESYRASCSTNINQKGCLMPADAKAKSYRIAEIKDAPLITYELASKFIDYCNRRGIDTNNDGYILELCKEECVKNYIGDVECDVWCKRNKECWEIIDNMRKNGIASLEVTGPFEGFPTIEECKLIIRMSTTLERNQLVDISNKLPQFGGNINKQKRYKLVKR